MSCVVDDLRAVRELLSSPERWTQGAYARNQFGSGVLSGRADACRWCIAGAADLCCPTRARANVVLDAMEVFVPYDIEAWNDDPNRTHTEVLALLDAAIEAEGKKEGVAK